jgi:hypothetical protein
MLIKVTMLNYGASYSYSPPQEDAVINKDHIASVCVCEARGCGPFVLIRFVNGDSMTVVGKPEDFVSKLEVQG